MSKRAKSAVDKARKTGIKKKFYITSPAGWGLVELLPKIDMATRVLMDLFANDGLEIEDYKAQKAILREYIEGIDSWTQNAFEMIFHKNIKNDFNLKIHSEYIKSNKMIYCNTELAVDAYKSFVKCDALNRCLMHGLRYEVITEEEYAKKNKKINTIMANCKAYVSNLLISLNRE